MSIKILGIKNIEGSSCIKKMAVYCDSALMLDRYVTLYIHPTAAVSLSVLVQALQAVLLLQASWNTSR